MSSTESLSLGYKMSFIERLSLDVRCLPSDEFAVQTFPSQEILVRANLGDRQRQRL